MLAIRKTLGVLVSLLALAGLLVTGVLATRRIDQRPRTDDAYLQADLVHMAPDVSGRIVELDVRDNQAVRKGEVLFRIDPEPYRMRMDQARAAVRGLEAKLALTADQVAAQTSKAGAAERGIGSAEAQRALASSTLGRLEPLLGQGFVTAQQVDQARTTQRTAQIALQQARLQADEARQEWIDGVLRPIRVAYSFPRCEGPATLSKSPTVRRCSPRDHSRELERSLHSS
jgi:multidrug efflux system membrane fusion protein